MTDMADIEELPVCWSTLIGELLRRGATRDEIAARARVTKRMVQYWRSGSHRPSHHTGELLVALYCRTMECPREAVPRDGDGTTFPDA